MVSTDVVRRNFGNIQAFSSHRVKTGFEEFKILVPIEDKHGLLPEIFDNSKKNGMEDFSWSVEMNIGSCGRWSKTVKLDFFKSTTYQAFLLADSLSRV